jgi:glycerol kinase
VTPPGLERSAASAPGRRAAAGARNPMNGADSAAAWPDMPVPGQGTAVEELARAVLAGDVYRARELAAAIAGDGAPTARLRVVGLSAVRPARQSAG